MVQNGPMGIHVLGRQQNPGAVPPLQPHRRWGFSLPTTPRHQLCSVGTKFLFKEGRKRVGKYASPCTILLNEQGLIQLGSCRCQEPSSQNNRAPVG